MILYFYLKSSGHTLTPLFEICINLINVITFQVILYFESLGRSEICPTISAFRTFRVANQKPAYVLVYDYYDQSRRARSFYGVDASNLCDISDDSYVNDCGDKKTFLRYESFQFGDNVDFHNSEASTLSFVVSAMAFSLVLSLALI